MQYQEPQGFRSKISHEQLQSRISELREKISEDYAGSSLIVIGVLKGAFLFLADLVRGMNLPVSIHFVTASSYSGTQSTGTVKITHELSSEITGRHVLIVDDIADTRLTLLRLKEDIQNLNPASVRITCLLNKSSRAKFDVPIDYAGFEIPDEFVIGYGMDLDGAHRNLSHIASYDSTKVEAITLPDTKEDQKIPIPISSPLLSIETDPHPNFSNSIDSNYATYGLLLHVSQQSLKTLHGDFRVDVFQNLYSRSYVLVVGMGDMSTPEPLPIRVHSSCITSEAFGAYDCDCSEQLNLALQRIAEVGRGAIVYLLQEGRGAGYSAKARDRMLVQASNDSKTTFEAYTQLGLNPDHRRYSEVALALRIMGVTAPIRLLTNNPEKARNLEEHGLKVVSVEPVLREASPYNAHYLNSKHHAGHTLNKVLIQGAQLPENVHAFAPTPLNGAPHLVQMASYLLPLRASFNQTHSWFWSHVYFDLLAGCERVVLTYTQNNHTAHSENLHAPCVRIQRESLFERFPVEQGIHKRQWQASVDAMVRHGKGVGIFPTADGYDEAFAATLIPTHGVHQKTDASRRKTEHSVFQLLAHHVPNRVIVPVFTDIDPEDSHRILDSELIEQGFIKSETIFIPLLN